MSTSLSTMIRLRAIQNKTRQLFTNMDDATYRSQYHQDLSPLGWHLGHCMFIENYWLHDVVQKNRQLTEQLEDLYIPENCPKPERGPRLPELKQLCESIHQQQDENDLLLIEKIPPLSDHPLFENEYLENFIIQHYAQHFETMMMILNQKALQSHHEEYQPETILKALPLSTQCEHIEAGEYDIGGETPLAYDNELPKHKVHIKPFNIALNPISNGEYLGFINDNGYHKHQHWSDEAWQWRQTNQIESPEQWRQSAQGDWYTLNAQGPHDLTADEPVYGISYYEAQAFADWAHARLPHENEWETSVRQERLHNTGKAWEWCSNTLYPYENFAAFPYEGYSKPWFDDQHYVLRGASRHTRPELRRASFRNFFNPDKRHFFAGLRLVFE